MTSSVLTIYIKYIGKQQSLMVLIMRATIYEDGVKRIKAKIEVPMDIDDVSKYIRTNLLVQIK